jgi:hypothetical protein
LATSWRCQNAKQPFPGGGVAKSKFKVTDDDENIMYVACNPVPLRKWACRQRMASIMSQSKALACFVQAQSKPG